MTGPAKGTVEELLEQVDSIQVSAESSSVEAWELWVPNELTLNGEQVVQDVAMAIVCDRLLGKGFFPDGFRPGEGGRLYSYRWEGLV